jgi:hypothetical protein
VFFWGIIMEDLLAKFYGKPESEGSSDAPVPDDRVDRLAQVEQRVGLIETQLLQIAKAQQTILSRLDTVIEQQELPQAWQQVPPLSRPEPQPQHEWQQVPPSSRPEPQPEPDESIGDGEGTPLMWDSGNKMLHTMDDASGDDPIDRKPWDDPAEQELATRRKRWANKPMRACASCGRRLPLRNLKAAYPVWCGPETLVCPRCYEEHKQKLVQKKVTIGAVTFGLIVLLFIAASV